MRNQVLTEHIVYKTLSTSLTLLRACFLPKGTQMPWQGEVSDGRKGEFHLGVGVGESTVSALCESFGISRTLAYRYIGRYLALRACGAEEQSRAPRRVWNRTAEDLGAGSRRVAAEEAAPWSVEAAARCCGNRYRQTASSCSVDDRVDPQAPRTGEEAATGTAHPRDAPDL